MTYRLTICDINQRRLDSVPIENKEDRGDVPLGPLPHHRELLVRWEQMIIEYADKPRRLANHQSKAGHRIICWNITCNVLRSKQSISGLFDGFSHIDSRVHRREGKENLYQVLRVLMCSGAPSTTTRRAIHAETQHRVDGRWGYQ